jgi:hypothetical protein
MKLVVRTVFDLDSWGQVRRTWSEAWIARSDEIWVVVVGRCFELHRVDHVVRDRTAPFILRSEHRPAKRAGYPAGVNSGATTICPRNVALNRISFTGW